MRSPRRTHLLSALGAALVVTMFARPAWAQDQADDEQPRIRVGAKVRVTTSGRARPLVGWLRRSRDRDSLRLFREPDDDIVAVSRSSIRRLEASEVRSALERAAPGMIMGGLAGLAISLAVIDTHSCGPDSSSLCRTLADLSKTRKAVGAFYGAGLGVLAGGLLSGVIVPAEKWTEVPVAGITLGTTSRGVSVSLVLPLSGSEGR